MTNLEDIAKRYMTRGKKFYEQQAEVLKCLLDDSGCQNILYMAPVANGKTLPPLVKILEDKKMKPRRMTLWFMPTISLAHDFLNRIKDNGNYRALMKQLENVKWVSFTGEHLLDKAKHKINMAKRGDPDILILSPESLADPAVMAWLLSSDRTIGQIVLDEAHLFAEWGITFRRTYFMISWLIKTLRARNGNSFKVIALSASLPDDKMDVVKRMLHFNNEVDTYVSRSKILPIGHKLICHSTQGREAKTKLLLAILKKHLKKKDKNGNKCKGVLFSPYKREKARFGELPWSVKSIAKNIVPHLGLKKGEWDVYTGSTTSEDRVRILEDLHKPKKGTIRLLLATSAFGFGIDINELDFSIHVEMPEDLDRLYQEISRCSRKPLTGQADAFYNSHEVAAQSKRLAGTLNAATIRRYLKCLGITFIRKGSRTLSLKNVLKLRLATKPTKKPFKSRNKAQMSADAYYGHALEAIIFLYRKGIIELRPLQNKCFPDKMSKLRNAFERGKRAGFKKYRYGKQDVSVSMLKLPIKIVHDISWPKFAELVEKDKTTLSSRTRVLSLMGKNQMCHWNRIADHYSLQLTKMGKPVDNCGHCNVCKERGN